MRAAVTIIGYVIGVAIILIFGQEDTWTQSHRSSSP